MSIDRIIKISTHPNVYTNNTTREMNVYTSEPSAGTDTKTGLCLFIPGYGGNPNSSVYQKMRSLFADKYNLVTVQCDYFGSEFMQTSRSLNIEIDIDGWAKYLTTEELLDVFEGKEFHPRRLLTAASKYDMTIRAHEVLDESMDSFNDMGIMQAMDNLTALLSVMKSLKEQGRLFNSKRTIIYGHSHGAYLGYLCNAFAPRLVNLLIDNSGWLIPGHLMTTRNAHKQVGQAQFTVVFDYMARKLPCDLDLLTLPILYGVFENQTQIVSFQGTSDQLIVPRQKRRFCGLIPQCEYREIDEQDVDGELFRSTEHGLNADFLKLFDHVMANKSFDYADDIVLPDLRLQTKENEYRISYATGLPMFSATKPS